MKLSSLPIVNASKVCIMVGLLTTKWYYKILAPLKEHFNFVLHCLLHIWGRLTPIFMPIQILEHMHTTKCLVMVHVRYHSLIGDWLVMLINSYAQFRNTCKRILEGCRIIILHVWGMNCLHCLNEHPSQRYPILLIQPKDL
jgi:hypothetical protein